MKMLMTLDDRLDGFVPPLYTPVVRNADSYNETARYYKDKLDWLVNLLPTAEHEQRHQLIRSDIDKALRAYHKYCIEEKEGSHYVEVGADSTDFEHVIPMRIVLDFLIDRRITVTEAFNVPTCKLSKEKHAELKRLGWEKSTPSTKQFWLRYTQVFADIVIETCDGHAVDCTTWDLTQHYKYFKII